MTKTTDSESWLRLLLHHGGAHRSLVAANALVLLAAAAFESVGVGMLVPLLDSIEEAGGDGVFIDTFRAVFARFGLAFTFTNLMLVFGVVMLAKYGLVALQQHLTRVLSASLSYDLMTHAYRKLLHAPLSFFYRARLGDLVATDFNSSRSAGAILEYGLTFSKAAIFSAVYIVIGCLVSLRFTLLLTALASVAYLFIIPRFRIGLMRAGEEKRVMDQIHTYLFDTLGGIRIARAYGAEERHSSAFQQMAGKYRELSIKILDNSILTSFLFEPFIFVLIMASMIIGVGGLSLRLSSLIVLLFLFVQLTPQVKAANSYYLQMQECLPHLSKVHDLISLDHPDVTRDGTHPIGSISGGISVEGLSFTYPGKSEAALTDVRLEIRRGRIVALVGESGGGKSTLVDLLLRHHDPDRGRILVDGRNLKDLKLDRWRALIGVVDQDPYLFNTSIEENILYGQPDATPEQVDYAIRVAGIVELIDGLEGGFQTVVGSRGLTLSGGQKQRVALARALIRDPELLILDEATSALDSESESTVFESILALIPQKTLIVIAHRLSTVARADKIVFIEKGRIVEEGDHDGLMSTNGRYRRYYELHAAGAG